MARYFMMTLTARREYQFGRGIRIYCIDKENLRYIPQSECNVVNATDEFVQPESFITLRDEQAQALMDQLWDCGIRPTEGQGSAGSLLATQHHLDDMRKIVFKKLNI